MLSSKFGIEIEFTGITRQEAAEVVSKYFDCEYYRTHDYYDSYIAKTSDGREWKLMYDSSITCRKREGRRSRPQDQNMPVSWSVQSLLTMKTLEPCRILFAACEKLVA